MIRLLQEIYHFIKDIFKFLWILQSKSKECQANLTQEMVYLHYKMNYGRSYFSSETLVKKKAFTFRALTIRADKIFLPLSARKILFAVSERII